MPILAMTFKRPASRALRYLAIASSPFMGRWPFPPHSWGGVGDADGGAGPEGPPAVANARYGWTALAPMVIRQATSWTSTASPAIATTSAAILRPGASRGEGTAPTASAIGIGSLNGPERRALNAGTPTTPSAPPVNSERDA